MCKSVEKGALHGTARPNAPLHGKRPPGGGNHITVLDMWAAHKCAPQNPTPVSQKFTKLDLLYAYQQVLLEESKVYQASLYIDSATS